MTLSLKKKFFGSQVFARILKKLALQGKWWLDFVLKGPCVSGFGASERISRKRVPAKVTVSWQSSDAPEGIRRASQGRERAKSSHQKVGSTNYFNHMTAASIKTTRLGLNDILPLTCTRSGACCHGKAVCLNPWELARLAAAKGLSVRAFRDQYCEFGGIRLVFRPQAEPNEPLSCSMYVPERGCSAHAGRPLACRLYPLGRERRGNDIQYMHRGSSFPCLAGCPDVVNLPHMSVSDYLEGQDITAYVAAQDGYLELMQHLADGAFVLLLETGLAASGDRMTLHLWRELGAIDPEHLTRRIGSEWIDRLMLPDISDGPGDPGTFIRRHHDLLEVEAQALFGTLTDTATQRTASGVMMGLALHLGRGLGADPIDLAARWIETAKKHGARD